MTHATERDTTRFTQVQLCTLRNMIFNLGTLEGWLYLRRSLPGCCELHVKRLEIALNSSETDFWRTESQRPMKMFFVMNGK